MKLYDQLVSQPWTTLVSLPRNDAELAKAAVRGGAQGLKIHLNVEHFASGTRFGTFAEERSHIEAILEVAEDISVGVVPGANGKFATPEEFAMLATMGVDYFDAYPSDTPAWALTQPDLDVMLAAFHGVTNPEMLALRGLNMTMCEASILSHEEYGKPLTALDCARYRQLSATLRTMGIDCPVIVPSQKALEPRDIPALAKTSVKGVLIGAIVTGHEADTLEAATHAFVNAPQE